jgi:hypothetical protein
MFQDRPEYATMLSVASGDVRKAGLPNPAGMANKITIFTPTHKLPLAQLFPHFEMRDRTEKGMRGAQDLITVSLIERHGVLAGIQLDLFESRSKRAILQLMEDGLPNAVTALCLINRHVTNLTASPSDNMKPADTDEVSGVVPSCQMDSVTLELVSLGAEGLSPWFAQDFPAQGVVGSKLGFGSWRPN